MNNIQAVLQALQQIVHTCRDQQSPMGYFPALYYNMTAAVQRGIAEGAFQDGARMERLDVIFAKRYITAFQARQAGKATTLAWKSAFDAAQHESHSVLQHLLLGINAHINLDLGIAAAETSPGLAIQGLEQDFNTINRLIAELTEKVQQRLNEICPPLDYLDHVLKTNDEGIADFSIHLARRSAWHSAQALAFLQGTPRQTFISGIDEGIAQFADRIRSPKGWVLRSALKVIRVSEIGSVRDKIDYLMRTD